MTSNAPSFLRRLLLGLGVVALLAAALPYPTAWVLASRSQTVQQIRLWDEPLRELNRWQYEEGDWDDTVVAIYGSPEGEPLEVVFIDEDSLLRPSEDPSLLLLPRTGNEHVFQVRTLYFFASRVTFLALPIALALMAVYFVLRKRSRATELGSASA
ncbi:MAG: hypothetical protein AUK47_15345 [Deltaproteobacteria bacterium CG2_30_63_29]|nr:MAG: hypothetical protein AUK47_15345 [Deltaproteobacteria bacterium CG2_30_63_29]PIW01528.1 MAG: hypothetical protein COW42_04590 [Deltaproteobacteria bacterium CG17_big_fil_post_rev_8_21_14_2_50_63_7]PJB40831.1 MAG: hypothetical protein CO108_14240 [Deltaproteobacteria bacterium CG_4_9_14_3_um_filter_63_12]